MRFEITHNVNDLEREVYTFYMSVDMSQSRLYLDHYQRQTRKQKKSRWSAADNWSRTFTRDNRIEKPTIPLEVYIELSNGLHNLIDEMLNVANFAEKIGV